MTNTKDYEAICSHIRTTHERDLVHASVDVLVKNLYHTSPRPFKELLEELLPYTLTKVLVSSIEAHTADAPKNIEQFLVGIKETLATLRVLTLELATQPAEEAIALISRWVRTHVGADVIIEFTVDPTMLGGARIAFGGKYKEVNLANMIESVLIREESRIEKMLI